jgi:hypothetical protein
VKSTRCLTFSEDGVNIAAPPESIAEPGICASSSAFDQAGGKIPIKFADPGEQSLKDIARPIRADAPGPGKTQPLCGGATASRYSLPAPRLFVVVLPFANLGGDMEQNYFADGATESLTTTCLRAVTRNVNIASTESATQAARSVRSVRYLHITNGGTG